MENVNALNLLILIHMAYIKIYLLLKLLHLKKYLLLCKNSF